MSIKLPARLGRILLSSTIQIVESIPSSPRKNCCYHLQTEMQTSEVISNFSALSSTLFILYSRVAKLK